MRCELARVESRFPSEFFLKKLRLRAYDAATDVRRLTLH